MPRRKTPSPIYIEWERIVFQAPRVNGVHRAEDEQSWRSMWENHIDGDQLAQTSISDAQLLCTLGWTLAIQHENYAEAIERQNRLFEHPDVEQISPVELASHRSHIAVARMLNGDMDQAMDDYRSMLNGPKHKHFKTVVHIVRGHLTRYAEDANPANIAPESFRNTAVDVVQMYPGKNQHLTALKSQTLTFAHIYDLLQTTYTI